MQHLANISILASSSGQAEPFPSPLLTCVHLVCLGPPSSLLFVPTIHISHMHPPLTTRWLNSYTSKHHGCVIQHVQRTYIHYSTFHLIFIPYSWAGRLVGTILTEKATCCLKSHLRSKTKDSSWMTSVTVTSFSSLVFLATGHSTKNRFLRCPSVTPICCLSLYYYLNNFFRMIA